MTEKYLINSIQRAFDILELYDRNKRELGISEIARRLNLHKSMVHRIVSTLQNKGVLEQNPDNGKYRLGLKLYSLGLVFHDDNELIVLSEPSLKSLTDKTGETSNLVMLDGSMAVYVAQRESGRMIRMFTKPGVQVYPHSSGAGKVLLSELGDDEIQTVIEKNGLHRYTDNTITSKDELIKELRVIRERGYAIDNGEREEGVMCIAAPVRDRHGIITASISISGPLHRFGKERIGALVQSLVEEARATSGRLGYES